MVSRADLNKIMGESKSENCFLNYYKQLSTYKIPLQSQFKFHPTRKWRFDFCIPEIKLAIEIDGGQWAPNGGRHNRDSDREKLNAAGSLGWIVLRFSSQMILQDPAGCIIIVDVSTKNRIELNK